MEKETDMKPVQIDYMCDNCEKGFYRPTGIALMTYPAKYPHKCTLCEDEKHFQKTYPYIKYRTVELDKAKEK